jgi:phage terminase large subunit
MPIQAEVIFDDDHKELLLSGAYGSAKTRTLCGRAVRKVANPGSRICLTRKTHTSLLKTTLRTLLEPDGDLPPVLPEGSYTYKEQKGRLFVHGGGEIVLAGCDNYLQLGSEQFSDVLIDEGIETEESEYIMLLGRLRVQYTTLEGTPNVRSIATATNPGAPSHYLYQRFYRDKHPNRRKWESNTSENYYLPQDYKDSLNELHGMYRQRYYLGQWVAFEGAIYPMFDPDVHVRHDPGPFDFYVIGVDHGMNHPTAMRVHGCFHNSPASHVVAEYHEKGVISPDIVKHAEASDILYNPAVFVVDPAAADLTEQLRQKGLTVALANNDVQMGIRGIQNDLAFTKDSVPLLTMEPGCDKGNMEYHSYRWKEGRDDPEKVNDDALDADRYARMYIRKGFGQQTGLIMLEGGGAREVKPYGGLERDWDTGKDHYVLDVDNPRLWDEGESESWN